MLHAACRPRAHGACQVRVAPRDRTRDPLSSVRFRTRPDHELDQLSDEQLIAYMREACSAGDRQAADRALALLVYGHAKNVERRMLTRMPRWAAQDAAHDAIVRAITSAFD